MSELKLKQDIAQSLSRCLDDNLADCAQSLFQTLGYQTDKSIPLDSPTAQSFLNQFDPGKTLNPEIAKLEEWQFVDLMFQLTKDEITGSKQIPLNFGSTPRIDNTIIESYLFFVIELTGSTYSRGQLAGITREINKLFPMPVMLVFKHGQGLTFSIVNRRLNKRDESRDVLEKVTLIKDIDCRNPHRAHIEILFDLSLAKLYKTHKFSNFVELHQAWQKTLDSTELNKKFFQEISDWYFWARQEVCFPDDAPKDEEGRDSVSLIRLITRLIFVWFLKEKRGQHNDALIPQELFEKEFLRKLITNFGEDESTYYKAILQNLFFATLNQEMNTAGKPDNRKFRGKAKPGSRDQHYMVHNVYRYEDLFEQPAEALRLFEQIPFLNGGLFECLDQPDSRNSKKMRRVDGFSDRSDNPLSVPNYLFFSNEQEVDLNAVYGTKKKRFKVRGLIDIFSRYKFTITENTPLEEEIALDPELLGKVFENLLAAYNPETKVTARKQTGSFYTPRAVVDYMVDESLLVYLENALWPSSPAPLPGVREKLRQLLDYKTSDNPFAEDAERTMLLIGAIDSLKVLDPAVGSGAFPMGMLQKLVFILGKLDPNNEFWKHQQKEREIRPVLEDLQQAQKISYEQARDAAVQQLEERLAEIEANFANNEMDYPRKLFLIENSIYGVDIQPIAVQIAKLRFFISLIVEQRVDDSTPNRGILPLPNLETKFVAANTLVQADRLDQFGQNQLAVRDPEIERLETELQEIRHRIFIARTPKTKQKYRDRDQELRKALAVCLKAEGLSGETATKLAQWDPYDQNACASFFDPEWMFGIKNKFDIVIGNPPYGAKLDTDQKEYFKKFYLYQNYQIDTYTLFLERSIFLTKNSGCITLIIPNTWLINLLSVKIRKWLFSDKKIRQIIHFSTSIFSAVVDTEVLILSNNNPNETDQISIYIFDDLGFQDPYFLDQKKWKDKNGEAINIFEDPKISAIADRLRLYPNLDQICKITQGCKPFQVGKGKPPQTRQIVNDKPYISEHKLDSTFRPLLRGSLIQKFQILWDNNYWISFGDWLAEPRYSASYDAAEKIVIRQTGDSLLATLDTDQFVVRDNLYTIVSKNEGTSLRFILGLINSRLLNWFYQKVINPEKGEVLAQVKRGHLAKLPIAQSNCSEPIINLVDYILFYYQGILNPEKRKTTEILQDKLMLNYFEQLINGIVYELYLPEDLHTHNLSFAPLLQSETLPALNNIPGDKLTALRTIFQRLYATDHPLRRNLFLLDTIPTIRIIEGKK